jgi:hypothetical protein
MTCCNELEDLTLDNSDVVDNATLVEAYKYKLIKSSKDKEAVLFNGYYFNYQRRNKTSKIFKCRQKKEDDPKTRMIMAFPYLLLDEIDSTWEELNYEIDLGNDLDNKKFDQLREYIDITWMNKSVILTIRIFGILLMTSLHIQILKMKPIIPR